MKRYVIYASVSLLTFAFGISLFHLRPGKLRGDSSAPLRLIVSQPSSISSRQYRTITIKNVSDRVVRGYSLGHTCNCRSWDSYDRPYPDGVTYSNPIPEHQLLQPGESQELMFETDGSRELEVWVDLVHFQGGVNWGPNQSHKEGYVRE